MSERLPTHLEVAAIVRRAAATGDFATLVRRGDRRRGSLLLMVSQRGRYVSALERVLLPDGNYQWRSTGPEESAGSMKIDQFLAKSQRFDEDSWVVDLDVADAERFIAETIAGT